MKMRGFSVALLGLFGMLAASAADLEQAFLNPPEATKPRCYWYWMYGQVSREGITRDLEAMKRVGIGEGYIGIIEGGDKTKALSDEWWQLVEHAVREGTRLGVDIGLFNCPGWSQSGGPWIKPAQSMRYVVLPETSLHGPQHFEGQLVAPPGAFQDVAVLAFPAPAGEGDTAMARGAKITRTPQAVTFELPAPYTARSVTIHPIKPVNVTCELQASDDGQQYRTLRHFALDRHNLAINVGPVPLAPVVMAFPATKAKYFRLTFSAACEPGAVDFSAAARVESYAEKSLQKVFQDPQPPFDFYQWPPQLEPDRPGLIIPPDAVRNLSAQLAPDGTLRWDVPEGEWIVMRAGMLPTGTQNSPAPPEATGLEVDKLNRTALQVHFTNYVGRLLARMPAHERQAWKHVVADSYEMGPQNWTDDFAQDFRQHYGYDPLPFLPVMSGRIVGSVEQSDRFLWDVRRRVADRVAHDYVGGLSDLCRANGMKMWLENYGHWGFPAEFLQYGGSCDEVSGEFWAEGNLGSIELRDASSAAHTYGKPQVFAEAFTGGPAFRNTPRELKARGDWAFCQGINQFVLHVYIHQPDERRPGVNAWFGTEFNRNNTWFEYAKPWIDYQRRCSVLLQAGKHVADVAYFISEDTPKMAGLCQPELPAGYNFDYINAEVIEQRLQVKDGRLVLPDGMSYRLLVLPAQATMRPELLKKIGDLVAAGGAVLGPAPTRSPSLQNFPACDQQVQVLAAGLWGGGRVLTETNLDVALRKLRTPPDAICPESLLWTHRQAGDADIYFLSNQKLLAHTETVSFRVSGRAPELWWPESGCIERPAVYEVGAGTVRLPIHFGPHTSVFVVFRQPATVNRIVQVTRSGQPLFDMAAPQPVAKTAPAINNFTMAVWARPEADTELLPEANAGIHGLQASRNDAFMAPHGGTFGPADLHAGAGLAIGRNGVAVFEHGAGYFAPVLVQAAPLTDWTHVAVVYRDGAPSLFLNGVLVHKGLASTRQVHPGVTDGGANPQFAGKLGAYETVKRALDTGEVAALMQRMSQSGDGSAGPELALTRGADGRLAAIARQAGAYAWTMADGRTQTLNVPALPAPVAVGGPWQVSFDPKWGGPEKPVTFTTLADWTKRAEPGIRYYSGVATYRTVFSISHPPSARNHLLLDLGEVNAIAAVRVNGQSVGTVWKRPYEVDIGAAVKPGANTLEVEVINTWLNRLVGDEQPGAQPVTATAKKVWKADTKLLPAGLLGPVSLRSFPVLHLGE
jgi:hypothetical protein